MKFLKKEALRTKPTPVVVVVFGLVAAAAVLSVGYIMTLAILAPEQLAEAAVTATDVICDGCVGTTDIADSAVTSVKIGSGQVKSGDIGTNAVTTGKISDTNGVYSVDIVNGQVKTEDIASGAIKPNVHMVRSSIPTTIAAGSSGTATVDCPSGEILIGGGFSGGFDMRIYGNSNSPLYDNTWQASGRNDGTMSNNLIAVAYCAVPLP
jgi:hypothetical protein